MDNWDDLRILHAVVRAGSITAGAQRLGIDQSTVSRRLQHFEQRFGKRLFSDSKKREHLTEFGTACAESAFRMEQETEKLEKTLAQNDKAFEGTITILAADFLSNRLLVSVVSDFLENYPKINLRVSTEPSETGGFDADVALFATNAPREEFYGRKLATATYAAYASHEFVERFRDRPNEMTWINWDDGADTPTWPSALPDVPDDMCRLRSSNVASLLEATRAGIGATILPCCVGETDPLLERLHPGTIVSQRDVWLFVQSDLRKVSRIRLFLDYLYGAIKQQIHLIDGD